jgi:hypothetical protein
VKEVPAPLTLSLISDYCILLVSNETPSQALAAIAYMQCGITLQGVPALISTTLSQCKLHEKLGTVCAQLRICSCILATPFQRGNNCYITICTLTCFARMPDSARRPQACYRQF